MIVEILGRHSCENMRRIGIELLQLRHVLMYQQNEVLSPFQSYQVAKYNKLIVERDKEKSLMPVGHTVFDCVGDSLIF